MVVKGGIYPQIKWVDKWVNHIITRVGNHATHQGLRWRDVTDGGISI